MVFLYVPLILIVIAARFFGFIGKEYFAKALRHLFQLRVRKLPAQRLLHFYQLFQIQMRQLESVS
ncbi:hypothetical protein CN97_17330 [Haematobacter massiliensis]|uniref:Uncharacterized protein n=1 Tax=Haematobacter massiliensis TaxID=195105 RepID=A0A086Y5A6_9RHOB|nr:hypothetical protein CN97_17330 [Haematobacter massiliensis]